MSVLPPLPPPPTSFPRTSQYSVFTQYFPSVQASAPEGHAPARARVAADVGALPSPIASGLGGRLVRAPWFLCEDRDVHAAEVRARGRAERRELAPSLRPPEATLPVAAQLTAPFRPRRACTGTSGRTRARADAHGGPLSHHSGAGPGL